MIRSVGIDLSRTGSHQVRCLDEQAKPCDSFSFDSTLEGLENFEKHVFSNGDTPTIIFEPTGLAWIPMAVYLWARHPECQMVREYNQMTPFAYPVYLLKVLLVVAVFLLFLQGGAQFIRNLTIAITGREL